MRRMLFQDPSNLQFDDGQSTFRLGSKWSDLQVGEVIELALVDVTTAVETPVAQAQVLGVVVGPYAMMVRRHASSNHAMPVALPEDTTDRPNFLHKIIHAIYGDQLQANSVAVAVYLKRLSA